jgi:PilZ domain
MAARTTTRSRRSAAVRTPGRRKSAASKPPVVERRESDRLEVLWQLNVEVLSKPMPASLREINTGGFALETTTPVPKGERLLFRLSLDEGASVVALAESVHSSLEGRVGNLDLYVTGFKFLDLTGSTKRALTALLSEIHQYLATA